MQQAQFDMQERQHKAELDAQLTQQKMAFDEWKVQIDNETKILVAQISAGAKVQTDGSVQTPEEASNVQTQAITEALNNLTQIMATPKTIIRDVNGRAQGIQ